MSTSPNLCLSHKLSECPSAFRFPFCCLFKCCLYNNGITSAKCHTKYQRTILSRQTYKSRERSSSSR
nr:MAG TPA: hypothetical protein [Bacteriophage sp.]